MNQDSQQNQRFYSASSDERASTSSTHRLQPIDTLAKPTETAPRIPTPKIDSFSFLDAILSTGGSSSTQPTYAVHDDAVQQLQAEKDQLDQRLREMQRRLEAAERRASMIGRRDVREGVSQH